jgi:hypothetical protein
MPITPDTKDWTWVLDRPCPECGFVGRDVVAAEVPAMVRRAAQAWRNVLASAARVTPRLSQDHWSTLEYGCHVRDVFRIFQARLALMLIQADPQFPNWDQDKTAVDDGYDRQDPAEVAIQLRDAAERLAVDLEQVPPRSRDRTGRRGDGARFTVDSLARYLIHDPIHHLHDVGAPLPDGDLTA